jgi:glycosyltransferase involved in cell wall biosynthesis
MTDDLVIAHKDYDCRGGGEVFVRRLAEYLDCPVVTGRRNLTNEPPESSVSIDEIPLSRPERWAIDRGGLPRTVAYMLRWPAAADQLDAYDTVITSGNEPLWWSPHDEQTVIAYTHSTPRFMYDLFGRTADADFDGVSGRLYAAFTHARRALYETNVRRPDHWIANSDLVARRIRQYWNIPDDQIDVVYPPVDCQQYSPTTAPTEDVYLHVGRLVDHKRVDEIVTEFARRDSELWIAGKGPARESLEQQAAAAGADNIRFLGWVGDERKQELMSRARAMVYPALNEDFGMVPIEAMAAGTPVIGVSDGFTKYQLQNGDNGILFERGELARAIDRFESTGVAWSPEMIARFADENFGAQRFRDEMTSVITSVQEQTTIRPELQTPGERLAVADGAGGIDDGCD